LSEVEKLKQKDADDVDEMSSAVMRTTLTVLLRYQRLLLSQFITTDKLQTIDLKGL